MKSRKNFIICSLIALAIILAFLPVILSDNYLRQDDLTFDVWPGMKFKELGYLYYNGVFQLVRPFSTFITYLTFLWTMHMENAVYFRLASVLLTAIIAILIFYWQLLFNKNKTLAACYAIAAFSLPAYQVFVATANYIVVIYPVLLTVLALFAWYHSYNRTGYILFFLSLLGYPLSSMFGWCMLAICYLNTRDQDQQFFWSTAKKIIFLMICYFLFIKIYHIIFHVKFYFGRSAVIDTSNLINRVLSIFQIVVVHSALWLYNPMKFQQALQCFFGINLLLLMAVIKINYQDGFRKIKNYFIAYIKTVFVLFALFVIAFSPTMAQTEPNYTFRYTLATMPILLYILAWSIHVLSTGLIRNFIFIVLALFGVGYSNLMLADGIVGPHHHDFNYLRTQLAAKALPLIKQNKMVAIHLIGCDGMPLRLGKGVPETGEYAMRICQYRNYIESAVSHVLIQEGYSSNFNKEILTQVDESLFIVRAPWGLMLIDNNDEQAFPFTTNYEMVTIDLKNAPLYNRFDFYKNLLTASA